MLFGPEPILAVQQVFGPASLPLFVAIDALGDVPGMVLVAAALFWLRGRGATYALLATQLLSATVVFTLMELLSVPRPSDPRIVVHRHISLGSFPSGHVATATVLWSTLALRGVAPAALGTALIAAVALSRLYLGAHHLADVLASPVIGGAALAATLRWWPALRRWLERLPFAVYLALATAACAAAALAHPFLRQTPNGAAITGALVGTALALPLEYRAIRYRPRGTLTQRGVIAAALGLLTLAGTLWFAHTLAGAGRPDTAAWLMAALGYFGAVLWGVCVVPAVLIALSAGAGRVTPAPAVP